MTDIVSLLLDDLRSGKKELQQEAFLRLQEMAKQEVEWVYELWDIFLGFLTDKDPHLRSIGAQLLAQLAKSDREERMRRDLAAIYAVTHDEKFVTARHVLQSLWKIAVVNEELEHRVLGLLAERYHSCMAERNGRLIRNDIIVLLRKIFDHVDKAGVRELAETLIALEGEERYRKKYADVS